MKKRFGKWKTEVCSVATFLKIYLRTKKKYSNAVRKIVEVMGRYAYSFRCKYMRIYARINLSTASLTIRTPMITNEKLPCKNPRPIAVNIPSVITGVNNSTGMGSTIRKK
jgi:hypothetical protein